MLNTALICQVQAVPQTADEWTAENVKLRAGQIRLPLVVLTGSEIEVGLSD